MWKYVYISMCANARYFVSLRIAGIYVTILFKLPVLAVHQLSLNRIARITNALELQN